MKRLPAVLLAIVATIVAALPLSARQAPGPTVGLALSGGSAKGIAHIGVLRVLERLGVRVDIVAGTSAGSVIGAMYAMGVPVDSIQRVVASADWTSLISDAVPRSRRFLEQRRFDERTVLNVPLEGAGVALPAGAIVGSNLQRLLEDVTWGAATVRRFDELPRRFVAVATDLETGEAVPLGEGVLSEVLRASSGIPGALAPVSVDGRVLVDGGLSRNLPAVDARELGADVVICSDVSDPLESAEQLRTLVDVLLQLASVSMLESNRRQRALCDVLIRPDVDGISMLGFDRVDEWVDRGVSAAVQHADELRAVAERAPFVSPPPPHPRSLGDSVRVTDIKIAGTEDSDVVALVRNELQLAVGDHVSREAMADRLSDLGATGLFGLARYRLDPLGDGATLAVTVDERPRDRLGVGLRYDDERSAALLFTGTVHNLLRFGSVTRVELRVGEETQIAAMFRRRRGVTGNLRVGFAARWSQAPLELPAALGGRADVEVSAASATFGLGAGRGTSLGVELTMERTAARAGTGASVDLVSGTAVIDHETLDRIDFPSRGADLIGRFELGGTDVTVGGVFSVTTLSGRYFVPVSRRITLDLGGFLGHGRGMDLPLHRRFYLGGTHRSTVFRRTHPIFHGLDSQEHSGTSVQVARAGLRWEAWSGGFLRAGVDLGGVRDIWRFPMERPMTGWSVSAGARTLVGPVLLELSQLGADRDPRVSISVGREL